MNLHIATDADIARATGLPIPDAQAAVKEVDVAWVSAVQTELRGLCGALVQDRFGTRLGEAASVRAIRREPGRFEGELMCVDCLKVFVQEGAGAR